MQDFKMQTFLNVCHTMNYTKTAVELNITQPAVSQHIAALEKHYRTKLFTYRSRKLNLTPAGIILRDIAMTMEHDEAMLREKILGTDTHIEHLRVGMTLTAGEYLLAQPLATYLENHPKIQAHLISSGTEKLLAMLRAGTIDCALVEGYFDKSDFDWSVFCREKLIGLCSPAHRFANTSPYTLDDLLEERILVREEGSGTRAILENALRERNLSLSNFIQKTEITSLNIIKTFVENDYGITFIYEAAARKELGEGTLARIELSGTPIEHDVTFLCLKSSAFRDEFQNLFSDLKALIPHNDALAKKVRNHSDTSAI
ncbi:MAG: LysR family transcriptional regulator [Raoultibacter sp.]